MSQAEELLNEVASMVANHQHPVTDSDTYYIIDPITRKVENKASKKNTIMQRDHNSERLTFECPRYIEGHDMSLCNATKVHYVNIDEITKEEKVGAYEVEDIALKDDDENVVICTWLISRNATQLVGPLQFWIQYACKADDELVYEWYTDVNEDITVKRTRNNGETIAEKYPDIFNQWKDEVLSEAGGGTVKSVNGVLPDETGNIEIGMFDEESILETLLKFNIVPVILDNNGAILTDDTGTMLLNL